MTLGNYPCLVVIDNAIYYLTATTFEMDINSPYNPQVLGGGICSYVNPQLDMSIRLKGKSPMAPFQGLSIKVSEMLQRLVRGEKNAARELAFEIIFNKEE